MEFRSLGRDTRLIEEMSLKVLVTVLMDRAYGVCVRVLVRSDLPLTGR